MTNQQQVPPPQQQQQQPEIIGQMIDPQQGMNQPGYFPFYYQYHPNYYANQMGHHPSAQHATGHPIYVPGPTMPMYSPHIAYGHPQGMFMYPAAVMSPDYAIIDEKGGVVEEASNYEHMSPAGTVPGGHPMWQPGQAIEYQDPGATIAVISPPSQLDEFQQQIPVDQGDPQMGMEPSTAPPSSQHILNPNVANFMTIKQQMEQQQEIDGNVVVGMSGNVIEDGGNREMYQVPYETAQQQQQEYVNHQGNIIYTMENVNTNSETNIVVAQEPTIEYHHQQAIQQQQPQPQVPLNAAAIAVECPPQIVVPVPEQIAAAVINKKVPVVASPVIDDSSSYVYSNSSNVNTSSLSSGLTNETIAQQPQQMADNEINNHHHQHNSQQQMMVNNNSNVHNVPNAIYTVGGGGGSTGLGDENLASMAQENLQIYHNNENSNAMNNPEKVIAWNDNNNNKLVVVPASVAAQVPQTTVNAKKTVTADHQPPPLLASPRANDHNKVSYITNHYIIEFQREKT